MICVKEINTESNKEVRQFLKFPFTLYKNCQQWVPPFWADAKGILNRKKHPFYSRSDASVFIAFRKNVPVGRIAMIENKPFNERSQTRQAFFYLFEVVDDFQVAKALFSTGSKWAEKRGLNEIYGPKGFAALNGLGMLTKGFQHRPAFGIPYNFSYYPKFLRKLGFEKDKEVLSGYLHRDHPIPEKIRVISEKVQKRWDVRVQNFQTRKDLRQMVPYIKDLYNGSLVGTSGNAPLTDADVNAMADQIIWFADPRIIKVLMRGEKAVGFLLAYPDISAALQKSNGRMLPFGWLRMLIELRRTKWINVNGAGIIDEYRGLGGTAVLFNEMGQSFSSGRYEHADLVQIGLENTKMQLELSSFGIDFYKSHCMFRLKL